MGLSYQELLVKIEAVMEEKFSSKFKDLSAELQELRKTNNDLINVNKLLIDENKSLRTAAAVAADFENPSSADDGHVSESGSTRDSTATAATENVTNKTHLDVLILSDSIFRHVGTVCPKERDVRGLPVQSAFQSRGLDILKSVYPGARCERLLSAAAELHQSYSFGQVIVSVGTNYIRRGGLLMPSVVANDICDFLAAIADLLDCRVSFSCILPQCDLGLINYINVINTQVAEFCVANGLDILRCYRFTRVRGYIDTTLFANDGVHLSFSGVEALFYSFIEHAIYTNMFA